jgi:hypothetical protein
MTKRTVWGWLLLVPLCAFAQERQVQLNVELDRAGRELPANFLGLSYEISTLLPRAAGKHYFDANDDVLVRLFKTLGIKDLRVGANAVDDSRVAVPDEADIDSLFGFARAAGAKVIYSFRLKGGDPANSARLAKYIAAHYADALDCFSIGNEPNYYLKAYPKYLAAWKPHYDAILQAVPSAMFDAPSTLDRPDYDLNMARDIYPAGHMAMISNHYYFFGSGRSGERKPEATRARFLSDEAEKGYETDYEKVGAVLAAQGAPYRLDEMNSCYNGGAKNASDTYASSLWALDCTHWWAAHHVLGVNYHTGDSVGRDGGFAAPNYASFIHLADGPGFEIRPMAYAELAFTQGAHGKSVPVNVQSDLPLDLTAYGYADGAVFYLTVINKSYGAGAEVADVTLPTLAGMSGGGRWERMDLVQKDNDVSAKDGIELGTAGLDADGTWAGRWEQVVMTGGVTFKVPACSAAILRYAPAMNGPGMRGAQ